MNCLTRSGSQSKPYAIGIFALLLVCSSFSPARAQSYQNTSFDPATPTLPPSYYGYDPEVFVKEYQEATAADQRARQKGEFETTAEYQKRLKEIDTQNPFASKTYAFAVAPTNISYDADSQTFKIGFKPEPAPHNINYVSVLLKHGAKDMGSYTAQNAFGATFTVTKSLVSSYELWLAKTEGLTTCTILAKVSIPEAQAMKPYIFALLVVKPLQPYSSVNTTFSDATFSEPHEDVHETGTIYAKSLGVRFYDATSGRILGSCP